MIIKSAPETELSIVQHPSTFSFGFVVQIRIIYAAALWIFLSDLIAISVDQILSRDLFNVVFHFLRCL